MTQPMTQNLSPNLNQTWSSRLSPGDQVRYFGTLCTVVSSTRAVSGGRCVDVTWQHPGGGMLYGTVNVDNLELV